MKRWHNYVLIGLVFGIFDWFYLDWLSRGLGPNLGENPFIIIPIMIGLNYGIWLVPVIPVVIYETKRADTIKGPILAAVLTWSCALFSYYYYYAMLLALGKLPLSAHLNIFEARYDGFWGPYWRMFKHLILFQFLEWIPIAIIGGGIVAALFWYVIKKRNKKGEDQQPLMERN